MAPGKDFCFQPVFRVQPPLVSRGTPQSHQVSSAERLRDNPSAMWKSSFPCLPSCANVHACIVLGSKTNLCPCVNAPLFSVLGSWGISGELWSFLVPGLLCDSVHTWGHPWRRPHVTLSRAPCHWCFPAQQGDLEFLCRM